VGGSLCLMDVPVKWYEEAMSRRDWHHRLKR
jgi:hypothetical protein